MEFITDKYPIEINDKFIDDDIENPNTVWRHKITNNRYSVVVMEEWSWSEFKYFYFVSLNKI